MAQLTQQIADTVTKVGVHSAYGDPIEIEGSTIMPVACTTYGFGAGEGGGDSNFGEEGSDVAGEGAGGAGGGMSLPIGAYITRQGYTRFEPNIVALVTVGIPFVWVAGRAIARIIRALKR